MGKHAKDKDKDTEEEGFNGELEAFDIKTYPPMPEPKPHEYDTF